MGNSTGSAYDINSPSVADPSQIPYGKPKKGAGSFQNWGDWATKARAGQWFGGGSQVPQPGAGGPQQAPTTYGSSAFDPTYMLPGGGTYSAKAPAPAPQPGLLSTPGTQETWYADNKDRLAAPTMGKTYADTAMPQLANKSYSEALYETGADNPWFARARDKGMRDIENRMSAAGVFGSGATGKAMYELEGDLGAAQAKEMFGLADQADKARLGRFGEARYTATGADAGQDRHDSLTSGIAGDVQDRYTGRVRMPLTDNLALADRYADVLTKIRGADIETQGTLKMDLINSIIAEGKMDYDGASQAVEEMLRGAGIGITAAAGSKDKTTNPAAGGSVPAGETYPGLRH